VNRHDDDASTLSDSLQHFHHHEGAGGVEARSWFVEEEHDGIVDDVDSDGDPAAFAARHATVALVADDGGGSGAEAELVYQGLDACFLLGFGEGARESELRCEHERLFDGEHGEEEVVLHDISGNHL